MYVTVVPNRGSPPAVLLRETYREAGKVKNRTLANLTRWKPEKIAALRAVLRDERLLPAGDGGFEILRSLPHGHIAAALGVARRLGLDPRVKAAELMPPGAARTRLLALALIVARLIDPAAKLATARQLDAATASHSLGAVLDLGAVAVNELYAALDWLSAQQPRIEATLARRHLGEGTLVLYDLTSTYLEGRCCPLAQFGYSRDGKPHKLQIVFGLLCTREGCPIAVEVFAGNSADPGTLTPQIDKLRQRFGLRRVVLVGDRGMITQARITQELQPLGFDWITALRAPDIKALAKEDGPLQLSLFDERDLAEVASPDYPGERLIVCRNPALAAERGRKRGELLEATELALRAVQTRVRRKRRPLRGTAAIGEAVGAVLNRKKMAKHFTRTITDEDFTFARNDAAIAAEAKLDGIYVLRTPVPQTDLDTEATVRSYKALATVERAFRSCKTVDLEVRPVFHWNEQRVRAHVFLCLLAYHLEWHMRHALAPVLFDDHDRTAAETQRRSPVAKARVSPAARRKAGAKRTEDGHPVHSFRTLLTDLATLTRNTVRFGTDLCATVLATPTPFQQHVFQLLSVTPAADR
jgi:Transposase DDE domain